MGIGVRRSNREAMRQRRLAAGQGCVAQTRQHVAVMPHHRMRLSVFFSMKEPMVWKSCTMTTIRATVTSITGVL